MKKEMKVKEVRTECPACGSEDAYSYTKNEKTNEKEIYCISCDDITGFPCPHCDFPIPFLTHDICPNCKQEY